MLLLGALQPIVGWGHAFFAVRRCDCRDEWGDESAFLTQVGSAVSSGPWEKEGYGMSVQAVSPHVRERTARQFAGHICQFPNDFRVSRVHDYPRAGRRLEKDSRLR